MHAVLAAIVSLAAVATASSLQDRAGTTANGTTVYSINYDKSCFYPTSVSTLDLDSYLGLWYQVAGYQAIFDVGCKCITANYTLNDDGTVHVVNECQELGLPVTIEGTASTADAAYGDAGVFDVVLNGYGSACPGPNYIVQEYVEDDYAIVQSPDFATLFVLSRVQNVTDEKLATLIDRSVALGSIESLIYNVTQTGCFYT